jgi:hypothetical protein
MQRRRDQSEAWDRLFLELCDIDRGVLVQLMHLMLAIPTRIWIELPLTSVPLILGA